MFEDYPVIYKSICKMQHVLNSYSNVAVSVSGCPFAQNLKDEIKIIETYEPKLLAACNNIFGNSYSYTNQFQIERW